MGKTLGQLVLLAVACEVALSFSDVGKWDLPMSGEDCRFAISKSLFKDTKLIIVLHCDSDVETNLTVSYKFRPTWCSPDYFHYFEEHIVDCTNEVDWSTYDINNSTPVQELSVRKNYMCSSKTSIVFSTSEDGKTDDGSKQPKSAGQSLIPPVLVMPAEGTYALLMKVQSNSKFNASFHIEMVAPSGYLSASMWPLLPFFGTMCGLYTILCTCWMIVCALQWRDLLRIQYWIGGVALMGMVESAVYYGVYSSINRTGLFNSEAYMFAEWVSVAKRALARMLVIIVSLGFGIVKPRLGPALQRVVGTGLLWALLGGIEAWLRLHRAPAPAPRRALLLAEAPLSLLDSAICWWVFVSLAHTMRTLQLRRNSVKLSLYRHFTNTLIFAVIASVIFMLYSLKSYRILDCITDWKGVWLDEAYWHMLFAGVLTAIMVLWRPTNNNQRYAFTPLLDNAEDDDEEEEQFVNDAYGVKMRGTSTGDSGDSREAPEARNNSLENDLRWVEDNIPASTLPLLDSDEEIINTKFEVSKMQ
ncbi:transmembrane protein 87A [Epargyreus clarus]|uniref:transmembrane protein 87A n=1 Tax=Epargyreus clarus TaxID=520877 RepID=UPI003C2C4871